MADLDDEYLTQRAGEQALAVQSIEAWVNSYTRGGGFYRVQADEDGHIFAFDRPVPALQGVILAAAFRLATSGGSISRQSVDGSEVGYFQFNGFTLGERLILDGYRRKAA